MQTENLSTLKIHKLSKAQYERELEAGRIDPNALYLTPDEGVDLSSYATKDEIPTKVSELTNDSNFVTTSGLVARATELAAARSIDGVAFNGSADISHFGVCSTAAETAAKTVAIAGFRPVIGARVIVKFNSTNTATNPTLNVNSTGACPIIYKGSSITAYPAFGVGSLEATKTYEFVFTGANYELVGGLHIDRPAGDKLGYVKTGGDITWTQGVGTIPKLDNKPDFYISETAPQTTKVGSIWFDTSVPGIIDVNGVEF
jgi:hypothetical protein